MSENVRICDMCAVDDHSAHDVRLAGVCVGCTCAVVKREKYDFSQTATDERMDAQLHCVTYRTADGWITDGAVGARVDLVADEGLLVPDNVERRLTPFLGDRTKAFHITNVALCGRNKDMLLIVADDGDFRVIDRAYADLFFDVTTYYGGDDPDLPLQDAPTADETNVVVMPCSRNRHSDDSDEEVAKWLLSIQRGRAALGAYARIVEATQGGAAVTEEVTRG